MVERDCEPAVDLPVVPRKPRRRWLGFRLRTLLLVLTVVCIWLGWWANSAQRQAAAVAAIEAADGFVVYQKGGWGDDTPIGKRLREWLGNDYLLTIDSVNYYVSNAETLEGLSAYHRAVANARWESIAGYSIYGESDAIDVLHKLGGVRRLHYSGPMTAEVMRCISEFPLERLVLQGNSFTHRSIRPLALLQNLKQLDLGTDKPDILIPYVAQLQSLASLSFIVSETPIA